MGERNLFGDLFQVLVERDVADLEGTLRTPMKDILSYLTPTAITLETERTYDVAVIEMGISGELGLFRDSSCVVGHGDDGVFAWAVEGAIDVVESSGTVICHIECCTKMSLIFVHVKICGAIVGVRTELEVAHFETRLEVGGTKLATDGSGDVVVDGDFIDVAKTSESVVPFHIADGGLALGANTLLAIDVEAKAELDEGQHLGVRESDTARWQDSNMHGGTGALVRDDTSFVKGSRCLLE